MVEIREKSSILVGFSPAHIAKKRKHSLAYSLFGRKKMHSLFGILLFLVELRSFQQDHTRSNSYFYIQNGRGIAIYFKMKKNQKSYLRHSQPKIYI